MYTFEQNFLSGQTLVLCEPDVKKVEVLPEFTRRNYFSVNRGQEW